MAAMPRYGKNPLIVFFSRTRRPTTLVLGMYQTWGELIVNANALLMHYFFPVIQGND